MMRFALLMVMLTVSVLPISKVFGQGTIYGDLEIRNDYYVRDSLIGASNTAQYDNLKSSVDAWLTVNYANPEWDFDASVRLDGFLHSNLFNPGREAYTGFGIGRFHLRKTVNNLEITGGYIYDQLGSGLIFRAYEDRALGIDDALVGVRTDYKISEALPQSCLLEHCFINEHPFSIYSLTLSTLFPNSLLYSLISVNLEKHFVL